MAWGFGRYAPEASAGRGGDSEKALTLRGGRREAWDVAYVAIDPARAVDISYTAFCEILSTSHDPFPKQN